MTPQLMRDETARETPGPVAQDLTFKERQGLAMSWVFSALGMFLLLGGLALGAAVVFQVGFVGWLVTMGLMALVMVAVIIAVSYFMLGSRR
jgi:hypothetical protein